ncbi:MAG: bifunctional nuclease family protein [Micropruina sp.]|nr:bifunctional nuclease family protein [Micropruina sp.]
MREMGIVEVRVAGTQNTPVVVLKEVGGIRHVAIWMSASGASSIVTALEDPDPDHPSSHDLLVDLVELFDKRVEAAHIVGHQDGQFYAELLVSGNALAARPSDALAVALRAGCPILCAEGVLAAVGIDFAQTGEVGQGQTPEAEVEKFREFLDSVTPDDFQP